MFGFEKMNLGACCDSCLLNFLFDSSSCLCISLIYTHSWSSECTNSILFQDRGGTDFLCHLKVPTVDSSMQSCAYCIRLSGLLKIRFSSS